MNNVRAGHIKAFPVIQVITPVIKYSTIVISVKVGHAVKHQRYPASQWMPDPLYWT
jgi:hypothetical protein